MNCSNHKISSKKNIVYIDLLRIFTIYTVIVLHLSAQCWNDVSVKGMLWQTMNFYNSFVRCNVSVFIMISGALLLDKSYKLSLKKLYTKNILRILVAYIFWSFIYAVISYFYARNTLNEGIVHFILKSCYSSYYHLWFLPVIIGLYMLLPMIKPITDNENAKVYSKYLLVIFFIFSVFNQSFFVFDIPYKTYLTSYIGRFYLSPMLGWIGFFLLGHYLKTYELKKRSRILIYLAGLCGFLVCWLGNSYVSVKGGVASSFYYFNFSISCFATAMAWFTFFKYKFENKEFSEKSQKIIKLLAKNTFGVYLIHAAILKILYEFGISSISFNPIISIPLISILVFIISFFISYAISKIPFISKYII